MKDIQEKKWFKISKLVVNIVFYALIVVLLLFSIANINLPIPIANPIPGISGPPNALTNPFSTTAKDSSLEVQKTSLFVAYSGNTDKDKVCSSPQSFHYYQ